MSAVRPTALIADDEPLLRDALARQLQEAWPELAIVASVRNGREALAQFEALRPDICFLDVHMPGMSGVEAATHIARRAQIVFVTAYDRYAVQAFAQGALDYLVKPVEPERLRDTVARLQERRQAPTNPDLEGLLARLAGQLRPAAATLNWLTVQVGATLRLIDVAEIDYLRSDTKYTAVAWRGDEGQPAEALVRTPLKDLLAQLDPARFVQVHRAVVVNLRAVSHVLRGENETATIHLKRRAETLPVSRNYLHVFRQM